MIVDSLNKLKEIKSDIKQALSSKGVEVGDKFEEYADGIEKINEGTLIVPEGMKFSNSAIENFPKEFDWSNSKNWTDFSDLFYNCRNLKEYPVLDVSNATNIDSLFGYNYKMTELPDWNWDTSKVTNMSYMFSNCGLTSVDLSTWDTTNVVNISHMFSSCADLETLSEINIPKVTSNFSSYGSPVASCFGLRNFGGFKNCKVTCYMDGCRSLSYESLLNIINGLADGVSGKTLYLTQDCVNHLNDSDIEIATNKGWSISPAKTIFEPVIVADLSVIPTTTYQITPKTYDFSQYVGSFKKTSSSAESVLPCVKNITIFEGTVKDASSLESMFYSSSLKYANITLDTNSFNCNRLFDQCTSLKEVLIETVNGASVNSSYAMFGGSYKLIEVDLSKVEFNGEIYGMFYDNRSIKKITLPDNFGKNATNLNLIFNQCISLEEVDLSKFNTSNVTSMASTFYGCNLLKEIDLTGWDLSKVEIMQSMFGACYSLTKLTMTGDVSKVTNVHYMFSGITTNGTFYYNPDYDYSKIIAALPATWKAVPLK